MTYDEHPSPAALTLLFLTLSLGGCAGSGDGLDVGGRPSDGSGNGDITADFSSIQEHVFTPICTVCHAGGGAPLGLRLDAANSYDLLVGVPSEEVPSLLRIKPGDPDHSYLVQKIEGHAAVGGQMPLGGPPLSADQISAIRQWVSDGAQPASATAAAGVLEIETTAPADDDLLEVPPPQILLGFNRPLDLTRIDPDSVRLERLEPSGPQPVAARLTAPESNPRALLLRPDAPLLPGKYRAWLRTAPGHELADLDAHVLSLDVPSADEALIIHFEVVQSP